MIENAAGSGVWERAAFFIQKIAPKKYLYKSNTKVTLATSFLYFVYNNVKREKRLDNIERKAYHE